MSEQQDQAGRRVRRRIMVWTRRVILTLLILSGLGMIAVALIIRHFEEGLPSTVELKKYSPPQVTRILARDGTLLGEDFVERRTVVSINDIPPQVKLAFLAAEDASFYEHQGLDYPGMLRAIVKNLRGSSKQGASTITQQVVKNVLLTQDRTYERKIKEVILARKIEQELTKDEILELYLNHIYFGHGRYGVEEAAQYYFGKSVKELTLGEAAILAGVPKGPSIYSPRDHLDKSMGRREYVLNQMVDKGFASAQLADEARVEPVNLAAPDEHTYELAPEVIAEARQVLREVVGDQAQHGGYTITTSIDPKLQAEARKAVREGLEAYDKRQKIAAPLKKPEPPKNAKKGAVPKGPKLFEGDPFEDKQNVYWAEVTGADDAKNELFVRVGTAKGRIDLSHAQRYNPQKLPASKFAEVGAPVRVSRLSKGDVGKDGAPTGTFKLELGPQAALVAIDVRTREVLALIGSYEGARGGFDRASSAHRQPGSSFKPFTYAQALRSRKFTTASLLPTDPTVLTGYKPKNYDPATAGEPKRMREVLSRSINTSAAWLVGQVGPESVVELASGLGIESTLGATPSIALGAYEVTPRELTVAYTSLAAGGEYDPPKLILKIVGPNGQEIPLPTPPEKRKVMSDAEAFVTVDLMKSVITDGTGKGAKVLKRPIAGKTGTSNEVRDAWFAGFSTDIACVAWTGFDDRQPLGAGESGGATSLPMFVSFMRVAHQGKPATDFPVPPGIGRATIDPKSGLLAKPEQEDALEEVFLAGTEPTSSAPDAEADAGPDAATPEGEASAPDAGPAPAPTSEEIPKEEAPVLEAPAPPPPN